MVGAVPGIVAVGLGRGRWALACEQGNSGKATRLRRHVRSLVDGCPPGLPETGEAWAAVAFVRVPAAKFSPVLGPAVLYHDSFRGTAVYCPATQLTPEGAVPLAAELRAFAAVVAGVTVGQASCRQVPTVRVARARHATLMEGEQPALPGCPLVLASMNGHALRAWVCENEITAAFAYVLGILYDAQAECLQQAVGRPSSGTPFTSCERRAAHAWGDNHDRLPAAPARHPRRFMQR
jgi:hypothetical protein